MIAIESMVTRARPSYTQDFLTLGICSLIKPAAMVKLMQFHTKIHSHVIIWFNFGLRVYFHSFIIRFVNPLSIVIGINESGCHCLSASEIIQMDMGIINQYFTAKKRNSVGIMCILLGCTLTVDFTAMKRVAKWLFTTQITIKLCCLNCFANNQQ